jgi:hypothetical protein
MFQTFSLFGQKVDYDLNSKWFMGLNIGGTWQSSDVTNETSVGYGFTLGRSYNYYYGKPFSFDIRGRYLGGYWYGQDLSKTDSAGYSGTILKPYMDSLGFGVNNFQAQNHELSLELVLHANRLREKTGFDPYIFGGLGFVWNQTYGDLRFGDSLGGSGGIYNYDPNQIGGSSYFSTIHDGQYETNLEGTSADIDKWNIDFMPSLGFGLGYQIGKRVTMGIEHKTTFTLRDDYDGFTSAIRAKNDWYHYTSLYINFRFRARGTTSTNVNNNVSNINNYNSNCLVPEIVFTAPFNNTSNVNTTGGIYTVKASVKNLETSQGLNFTVNGVSISNFIFKPELDYFEANVYLASGSNSIQLTGTNNCGQDQETTQLNYTPCIAPIVSFTNPSSIGSVVENQTYTVQAAITNLNNGQISIMHNNAQVYNYMLDPISGNISFTVYLASGENTFTVNASNNCGSVVSTSYIRYERCLSPTIYANNLNATGITVSNQSFNFSAVVNYATGNQIILTHNNQQLTNFSYNTVTGQIDKNVTLIPGINTFVVKATNACGTATQTYIVNYTRECVNPIVNINSIANNSLVYTSNLAFSAQVFNVVNNTGITLSINGLNVQNFNFNPSNGLVYGNFVLIPGVNTIVLRATNDCGTVTQSISVNYQTCNLPTINSVSPATDISSVNTTTYNFESTISNLIGQQDVTLNLNGQNITNFSFQSITGKVSANLSLNLGSNILIVSAQNTCGSVSKTYVIDRLTCNAPVVLLSNTAISGSTVTSNQYNLLGTVTNLSAANGITVTLNGQVVSNVTFNATNGQISKTLTLSPGFNTITVSAVNSCGSVSESYNINYLNCTAPTISVVTPSVLNSSVNNEAFTFSANIGNITQSQGVTVTLNGQAFTNYNFSSATGRVSGTLNLNPGANTIVITATNPCGAVSETISVNFLNCKTPVLNISSPVSLNSTVSIEDFAVSASVSNVTASQGVTITLNGQVVSNGFNPTTGKVSALFKLIQGQNTIVITVTNDCGTVNQTITVVYNPIVTPPTPPTPPVVEEKITICHIPPGNSGNPQTIEIPLSAWPAHQAHGDVIGACVETPTPPTPPAPPVVEEKITICHIPPGNSGNPQTIEIPLSAWPAHQAHGDVVGACAETPTPPTPPAPPVVEEKITICHIPPGNSGNPQTIEIPLSAWPAHQAHGDVIGACVETPTPPTPPTPPVEEQKITICHYPPGNVGNPQTLEIPISAWPAHQAHGDIVGTCVEVPNENGNNQNGNGNSGGQNGSNGNGSNGSENGGNNGSGNGNGGNGNGGDRQIEKPITKPTVKPEVTPPAKPETKEEKPINPPKPSAPVTPKGKGGGQF